jgi:hypothetical protein
MIVRFCTKVTIWDQRYYEIPDNTPADKILEAAENSDSESWDHDYLPDTAMELDIHENDGFATIEIYNVNNENIYKNGK